MFMKSFAFALPLFALAACGQSSDATKPSGPVAAVKPPAGTEWATTVVETPDGGMRMGNPNAPIKLVEYGSMSCSHCAEFSEKAMGTLKANYIASGKVSYELRNYVRDPMDLTATLLARCGGPGPFFPLVEQMFADQANWFTKVQAIKPADQQAMCGESQWLPRQSGGVGQAREDARPREYRVQPAGHADVHYQRPDGG
jgi:protein-disulfide isomerase